MNLVFCLSHAQVSDWLQFSILVVSCYSVLNFVYGLILAHTGLIIYF